MMVPAKKSLSHLPGALGALTLALCLSACTDSRSHNQPDNYLIATKPEAATSSVAGNLVATAIKEIHHLDMVFYPRSFISNAGFAMLRPGMTEADIAEKIAPLYPTDARDDFLIGTLEGKDIIDFVRDRAIVAGGLDLEVAGLSYDLRLEGSMPKVYDIKKSGNVPIKDDDYYLIAVSRSEYSKMPGYQYGNGFSNNFNFTQSEPVSAQAAIKKYLLQGGALTAMDEVRGRVERYQRGAVSHPLTIQQIQGKSHLSPYRAMEVTIRGIVTAVGNADINTDNTTEMFLEDATDDGDPRTSRGIKVILEGRDLGYKKGELLQITAVVHEVLMNGGLTSTELHEVKSIEPVDQETHEPAPAVILGGAEGLKVPGGIPSSYRGNVLNKPELDLSESLDFWESIEGMRIKIITPLVIGFRGGKEKQEDSQRGKSYLNLNIVPSYPHMQRKLYNTVDGEYINDNITLVTHAGISHSFFAASDYFLVGRTLAADVEGVVDFDRDNFGSGKFVVYPLSKVPATDSSVPAITTRQVTRLTPSADRLRVASFNVENLSPRNAERIETLGRLIAKSLLCPDILVLPEVQDNNGTSFYDDAAADETLAAIIAAISCEGANYRALNIDPVAFQDGGQPGGNIRVAMLYNASRVEFTPRGQASAVDANYLDEDGKLALNPGRIAADDPAFKGTRKPLAAEFGFRGKRVIVIGNHLNSKLGDPPVWTANYPLRSPSETLRIKLTKRINDFAEMILKKDPAAAVVITGDMNALWNEGSMQVLAGKSLMNLMTAPGMVDAGGWYSSNYDGRAQMIDQMFVSRSLLDPAHDTRAEILHVNSDWMEKLSDHDPIMGSFKF
jgi:predicted extracellular nuclease